MSDKWVRDTGLVFAFVFLMLGVKGNRLFLGLCGFFLLSVLFVPAALKPLAYVWMKIAEVLGKIMNKVFFGMVFVLVIVPMGYLKRLLAGDMRDLTKNKSRSSAFVEGKGLFTKEAFEKPY